MIDQTHTIADAVQSGTLIAGAVLVAAAALSDLRRLTIPNGTVIALMALGTVFVVTTGGSALGHAATFLGALALGFALYAVKLFGAGDGKLFAAAALWAGPAYIVDLTVFTALFGAALSIVWVLSRPLRLTLIGVGLPIDPEPGKVIPYGVAIAGAAGLVFAAIAGLAPSLGG